MTKWLGTWELIPELSHYDIGDPAKNGRYRIYTDGERVVCDIAWHDNGQDHALSYGSVPDGRQTPADFPGLDTFSMTAVSDSRLDSDASADGAVVATAARHVSTDGQLMSVHMGTANDNGGWTNVYQVYRRADG